MPTIDLSDEELQGLIMLCAQGSGPGITWMLTNGILAKAQQAAQKPAQMAKQTNDSGLQVDGLDHEPIAQPPAFTGKAGARR